MNSNTAPEDAFAYVGRALERERHSSIERAEIESNKIAAEMSSRGTLQSGPTFWRLAEAHVDILNSAAKRMAKLAFDATGETSEGIAASIESNLRLLQKALSDALAGLLRRFGASTPDATNAAGMRYDIAAEKIVAMTIDDFRHGMLEGVGMTRQPALSIVGSIVNSPGAGLQSGDGNIQTIVSSSGATEELRHALREFLENPQVMGLAPTHRQDLSDVVDVMTEEIAKPAPDGSKLVRWGRKLLAASTDLGVAVAAAGISKLLFG